MTRSDLMELVIKQIKRDVLNNELSALENMLEELTTQQLRDFLPDDDMEDSLEDITEDDLLHG